MACEAKKTQNETKQKKYIKETCLVHRLIIFWTLLTAAELLSPVVFCSQAEKVPKQDLLTLTQGTVSLG